MAVKKKEDESKEEIENKETKETKTETKEETPEWANTIISLLKGLTQATTVTETKQPVVEIPVPQKPKKEPEQEPILEIPKKSIWSKIWG